MNAKSPLDTNWFTEKCLDHGSAFSFEITEKLHEEKSPFQHIEIYATKTFGNLMVIDGCIMLTTRDNFLYHEMMTHTALFTHPAPQHVVIIGGGDCGSLKEVLKHTSVKSAVQIDIDERVTRLAEKYFPELCTANNDPRAQLAFEDGIKWMKNTKENSLDIIIIDSTDPVGPAEGLFSEAFYRDCLKALKSDGILIQQTESPLYHTQLIKDTHQAMRNAGFKNMQLMPFPQPCYPSGWWSSTMASTHTPLKNFREQAALNKNFKTQYYNAAIHQGALATPEFLQAIQG